MEALSSKNIKERMHQEQEVLFQYSWTHL